MGGSGHEEVNLEDFGKSLRRHPNHCASSGFFFKTILW